MHTEILTSTQLAVLDGLRRIHSIGEFYLAGGTALALRHGHRRSVDFDFFRVTSFDAQDLVLALEGVFGGLERLPSGEQTLYVRLNRVTTARRQLLRSRTKRQIAPACAAALPNVSPWIPRSCALRGLCSRSCSARSCSGSSRI